MFNEMEKQSPFFAAESMKGIFLKCPCVVFIKLSAGRGAPGLGHLGLHLLG